MKASILFLVLCLSVLVTACGLIDETPLKKPNGFSAPPPQSHQTISFFDYRLNTVVTAYICNSVTEIDVWHYDPSLSIVCPLPGAMNAFYYNGTYYYGNCGSCFYPAQSGMTCITVFPPPEQAAQCCEGSGC